MSLTSYAELKASMATFLNRSDLTAQIPDFITLFEAKANRTLMTRQMIAVSNAFAIGGENVAVPSGFAGVISFRLATSPVTPLEYRKPDDMDDILDAAWPSTGKPRFYTVVGDTFVFSPAPDAAYTARLRYRQTLTPLSDANPSNWLLARHPDAYLWGSLLASAPYLKHDARLAVWGGLLQGVMTEIAQDDAFETLGPSPRMAARSFG